MMSVLLLKVCSLWRLYIKHKLIKKEALALICSVEVLTLSFKYLRIIWHSSWDGAFISTFYIPQAVIPNYNACIFTIYHFPLRTVQNVLPL